MIKLHLARNIIIHALAEFGYLVNSFVINCNLAFGYVVINDHLLGTDYYHLPNLSRVKPADMNTGNNFGRISDIHKSNIIDPILNIIHAITGNRNRANISHKILYNADIMRSKIPQSIDIGTYPSEIQPLAADIPKFTEMAFIYIFFYESNGGVIQESMPDHRNQTFLLSQIGNFLYLFGTLSHWFFDQNMFA